MKLSPQEIKTAQFSYVWLWFSPVLTIPTLFLLYLNNYNYELRGILCPSGSCTPLLKYGIPYVILFLISSLWHLILLIPALNQESDFVRWHGWQALALAYIRTFVPIGLTLLTSDGEIGFLLSIPVLLIIWLAGNSWGHIQAAKGKCSLMQWFGYEIPAKEPKPAASWQSISAKDPNSLVEVFRFSHDTQKRKSALEELKKLGLVEHLDNANAPTSSINHT